MTGISLQEIWSRETIREEKIPKYSFSFLHLKVVHTAAETSAFFTDNLQVICMQIGNIEESMY